ncbi:MAG: ParB/RepB/Spo0J family partition protein [Capsulimonadales bacterium]|nr:ParB/RepB/Spo0J family partition protein [Capsulimonadales bacterium]
MALEHLPLEKIRAALDQPRKTFYQESLEELAASIKERGVLEPIVVRPLKGTEAGMYEIIMGERRYRASRLAGKTTIPAIVKEMSDEEAAADALLENFQREDLNPLEKARAVESLLKIMSYEKVCKVLGVSETTVRRLMELLELSPQVQQELVQRPGNPASNFSEGHARALSALNDDPATQARLIAKVKQERLSVNALEQIILNLQKFPSKKEVFLRVSHTVGDQMVRSLTNREERKKPYRAQTAKEHLKSIDKQAWTLTDLLDERIVEYLTPEEMNHLLAITMQATRQMEIFNHRVRTALENRTFGFKEVYIHCPLCGRIELIGAVRCSTCWSVLRRCCDCGNFNRAGERCELYNREVKAEDAENPKDTSPSFRCPDYRPKFTPKLMKMKMSQ